MVSHVLCVMVVVLMWLQRLDGIFSGVEGCQDNCEKPDRLQVGPFHYTYLTSHLVACCAYHVYCMYTDLRLYMRLCARRAGMSDPSLMRPNASTPVPTGPDTYGQHATTPVERRILPHEEQRFLQTRVPVFLLRKPRDIQVQSGMHGGVPLPGNGCILRRSRRSYCQLPRRL